LKRLNALLALSMVAVLGCTVEDWRRSPGPDDAVGLIPWFATMKAHIATPPLKSWCAQERPDCRQPVEGTVPITGVELALQPAQMTPGNAAEVGRMFSNPTERTAVSIERGKDRYDIFCAVCHGVQGAGDGTVSAAMGGIVPSLLTDQARGYPDGYMYGIIREGRGLMKSYGARVSGDDRWNIVNYIRVLQGTAQ